MRGVLIEMNKILRIDAEKLFTLTEQPQTRGKPRAQGRDLF